MHVQMIPVDSSNLSTVGYSHDTEDMYVGFRSGDTYRYPKVPAALYHEMMAAARPGQFFVERFKKSGWVCHKIT